jgi:hypothetical protein
MSWRHLKIAMDIDAPDVAAWAVLVCMARHASEDGDLSWTGNDTLAAESKQSVASVRRALKRLVEAGLIEAQPRRYRRDGSRASDCFRVTFGFGVDHTAAASGPSAHSERLEGEAALPSAQFERLDEGEASPSAQIEPSKRSICTDQALNLAPLTSFERFTEESREDENKTGEGANVRPPDPGDLATLAELLIAAVGPALGDRRRWPRLDDISAVLGVLGPGEGPPCSLELDVLPAARECQHACGPQGLTSWRFVAHRAVRKRNTRLAGAPAITQPEQGHDGARPYRSGGPTDTRQQRTDASLAGAAQALARRAGGGSGG